MREYFTLHRSVFPSYLTIESGRIDGYLCLHLAIFGHSLVVAGSVFVRKTNTGRELIKSQW